MKRAPALRLEAIAPAAILSPLTQAQTELIDLKCLLEAIADTAGDYAAQAEKIGDTAAVLASKFERIEGLTWIASGIRERIEAANDAGLDAIADHAVTVEARS